METIKNLKITLATGNLHKVEEINLIAKLTDQNVSSVMAKITFLEIEGKIKRLGGNKIVAV